MPLRIVSVESSVLALPFTLGGPHPRFAGRPWTELEILLVRVETEDGVVGWGEAFGHAAIPSTRAALDTIVAPLVIGWDAGDIAGLTRHVLHATHLLGRNGSFVFAFSGIEIALWDILGKRAGLPLHRLLGGPAIQDLPAYASLLPYGDAALAAANTAAACAAGYRHVKLHELTLEAVRAARAAPGVGDAALMLDVNCPWSVPTALERAHALRNEDLAWLEEPVWPPEDADGLAQVRRLGIPIAAGENVAGVHGFKSLIAAGALDIAQPSVTKIGGVGEWLRVFDLCTAHGVRVVPHSPYLGPGFLATLHIAAARLESPLVEVLWLETQANPFSPWTEPKAGRIGVPQGPGLGCDPDPDLVARYRSGAVNRVGEGR